ERIEAGIDALAKKAMEMGAELRETERYLSLELPDRSQNSDAEPHGEACACERCKAETALLELQTSPDSLIWFNISEAEFVEGKKLTNFLRELLGETVGLEDHGFHREGRSREFS